MLTDFDWIRLEPFPFDTYSKIRLHYHMAVQNVAAVGRTFLNTSGKDENARLAWIPGLWRMAGKWVPGEKTFRSSIDLRDSKLYLVDERLNELASFTLAGSSHRDVYVWLEEQIGSQQLTHQGLSMTSPYELPVEAKAAYMYAPIDLQLSHAFGQVYHNTFAVLSALKKEFSSENNIYISPSSLDQKVNIVLLDTGNDHTNTVLIPGYFPGNLKKSPYFYVRSRPHATFDKFPSLTYGSWENDDTVQAVLSLKDLWLTKDQRSTLASFYEEAATSIKEKLIR